MQSSDSPRSTGPAVLRDAELTTAELLAALASHVSKPLSWRYEGRDVLPGYHVTEVKSGAFEALDCGANREVWRETFIQLWDIPAKAGRSWMPVGRFLAIMHKVAKEVELGAKLTVEVSDGVRAMQLYSATAVEEQNGAVRVQLTPRPSSCKPYDRWVEQQHASACCDPPKAVADQAAGRLYRKWSERLALRIPFSTYRP
jgi:hypothetical protein